MSPARRPHLPSLVTGLCLVVFGVALLLDTLDVLDVSAGAVVPALLAIVGAALLASGVRDRRR
jgi:hypothetical protein